MRPNWKLVAQWVAIGISLVGFFFIQDRRVTTLEAQVQNEMKGYDVILKSINGRLEAMETNMNRRFERLEVRIDQISDRR